MNYNIVSTLYLGPPQANIPGYALASYPLFSNKRLFLTIVIFLWGTLLIDLTIVLFLSKTLLIELTNSFIFIS